MFSKLKNKISLSKLQDRITNWSVARKIALFLLCSYGRYWNFFGLSKRRAMRAILAVGGEDEKTFDLRGKETANELKRFVGPNSVVLDLGCGIGRVEKYLAPYCREVHGVDVSRMMLKLARERLREHKNVFLYKNNGKDLSIFPEEKFDFAFSIFVLQHLEKEDAYSYLVEINRVLKKEGKIYVQFPNFLHESYFIDFVNQAKSKTRSVAKMRYYTAPEVRKIIELAGLDIISLTENSHVIVVASKD